MKSQITVDAPVNSNPLCVPYANLIQSIFDAESDKLNQLVGEKTDYGRVAADKGYKCIHLSPTKFLGQLDSLIESENLSPRNLKFLDVGCGVGQKVFMANQVFKFNAFGFDLRPVFVEGARKLLNSLYNNFCEIIEFGSWNSETVDSKPKYSNRIFEANALTFDGYKDYNIIYFYCPISDNELEKQLEKRIATEAKVGTIVIANLPCFFRQDNQELKDLGWELIGDGNLFFKRMFDDSMYNI